MGISGKYFIGFLGVMFFGAILPCHAAIYTMHGSMDSDKTVSVETATWPEDGSTELVILTKKGTSYSPSDLNVTVYANVLDSVGPWWNRCTITVSSGSASINCIDSDGNSNSGSDAISIDSNGVMTRLGSTSWQCHLDSGKTVAGCTETDGGAGGAMLSILTIKGSSYANTDFFGVWDINVLSSPGPYWMRGSLTVDSSGNFTLTGNDSDGDAVSASGSASPDLATGLVTITPSSGLPFQCHLDAGKTVMGCTQTQNDSTGSTAMIIMTKKAGSYSPSDLTGTWYSHELATGNSAPWWSRGIFVFGAEGSFTGSGTGYDGDPFNASGIASVSLASGVTIQVDDFSATPTSGGAPLTVNFTDATVHSPTSWSWDFGDGSTSTLQNPSHTYVTPGNYLVTLTATAAGVPVTVTKSGFIKVSACGNLPAKRLTSYYSHIQDAYNSASANGQTVQILGIGFTEDLSLANTYSVKLQGGYDCAYLSNPLWTTITGKLTFKGGAVTVEELKIK